MGHRQMSTVLLKRNLVNLYISLAQNQKVQFRDVLLNQYIKQTSVSIQRGIAVLIGILVPVVQLNNWSQLKQLLDQAISSAPESIATFILLNCLLYHFTPPKQLYAYLLNALQVPNLIDQALKCIMAVAQTQNIDQSLAVQLIKIWGSSNWSQQISLQCIQIISILAQRKIKLSQQIIEFICNNVVVNTKLSTKFRISGMDFLSTYSEFNGKALANKDGLLKKIVTVITQVCSEPFQATNEEQQVEPVQQIALWFIQNMSMSIKPKKIYPILLDASIALINSEDVNKINTGYLLLGAMSEGCADKLKKNLSNPVMNVLIPKGLAHSSPQVRGAAINALSYFSQYLIPDIVNYHSTIIPAMIGHFDDMSSKVSQKALIAIDVFFDNMEQDQIATYLPVVVPKLSAVVVSEKSTFLMRDVSMSALGAAIEAARQGFQPFVQNVYNMCLQILKIGPSPQMNSLRSQNITVLAKMCNIFCKSDYAQRDNFYRTFAMPVMQPIYTILTSQNDPEIRQSCFMFFYLLANAIENDFTSIFDKIIPEVFKSAALKVPEKPKKKQFSLDSDSQDQGAYLTQVQVSQFDQKAAAIRALGQLANACPMNFGNYFQQAYKILDDHHQFFYQSVRMQVSTCYVNLIKGYVKSQNNGTLPAIAYGLPVLNRYPEALDKFIQLQVIPKLMFLMTQDDNRRVSSQAIVSMDQLVKALGPVAIDHSLQKLTQTIIQLLQNQVAESDDQQQAEDQDDEDADAYIFEPLCGDLIPTLSDVLQGAFLPFLNEIFPYMSKFLEQRQNINENVQMTGCIAQLIKNVPSFFDNRAQQLFTLLSNLVKLDDTDVDRNIAYCFAEALQKSSFTMRNYLEHTLVILKNIYENKNSHQACKDNALAAICRSIIVFNPPMPYEIFVNNLIQSMPFKGDQQQQKSAVRCLIHLANTNSALLIPHKQQIIAILENDIASPNKYKLEGEVLVNATNFLNSLKQ